MDRRTLLLGLGSSALWFSVSGCVRQAVSTRMPATLPVQLAALADPHFQAHAADCSAETLYFALVNKGVITPGNTLDLNQVRILAQRDPLVIYKGFYYSETEMELYALALLG